MTTSRADYVSLGDGRRLRVSVNGHGAPVVLVHGGPGMWDYFGPLETLLCDGHTVVRYDQRGCGRSDEGGPYSVDQFVDDLECLRRELRFERWVVAGHSWGASLALAYAWRYGERVRALIYISGTGLGQEWKAAYKDEQLRRLTEGQNQRLDELSGRERSAAEEREFLTLGWSRDFADRSTAPGRAAEMLDDRCRVNYDCNAQINAECKTWHEED
ncbi:MAG TPA: alpha/beta fold hydrolase, partial [Dehalococcoidia bacterium]|nr:alpha/beta fold hydrolase [Dehalococcoidia bacterium]